MGMGANRSEKLVARAQPHLLHRWYTRSFLLRVLLGNLVVESCCK